MTQESTFTLDGRSYAYFDCRKNERCVEVALGLEFLSLCEGHRVMEVGNVMRAHNNKYPPDSQLKHFVLDKDEVRADWINYKNGDVMKWSPNGMLQGLLSISTLEHIPKPLQAIERVLDWAANTLITLPLGYPSGDVTTPLALRDWGPGVKISFMARGHSGPENWRQISREDVENAPQDEFKWGQKYEQTATAIAILRKQG